MGSYWGLTVLGYGLTAVCVPLLAVTPFVGAAGLALACALLLAERTGKAIRSPSKSALLAQAAAGIGRGRGFGVHKALDQVGAFAGPLLVAGIVALSGAIWPAMAALALPGAASMLLLGWLRRRSPADRPPRTPPAPGTGGAAGATRGAAVARALRSAAGAELPPSFLAFAASSAATTAGLVTFGVLSYHLTTAGVLPLAAVPLLYAAAMAAGAVSALAGGLAYDRWGGAVLYGLPPLVVAVPMLAFSRDVTVAAAGALVWGAAVGLQDSTVKALVADLVPGRRRASAYGVFAGVQGAAAVLGGGTAGALYARSVPLLVAVVAVTQVAAALLLAAALRRAGRPAA